MPIVDPIIVSLLALPWRQRAARSSLDERGFACTGAIGQPELALDLRRAAGCLRFPGAAADGGAVWKFFLVCLICASAVVLGFTHLGERPALVEQSVGWVKSLGAGEPAPVLVLLVADRSGVAMVGAAVDPARILVQTPDAIVLREGRVIATGPEMVGGPLSAAGFADRSIELWAVTPPEQWKRDEPAEGELSLAGLASKPTLTPGEVIALLNGSVRGVQL